jgi:hypothetical protein
MIERKQPTQPLTPADRECGVVIGDADVRPGLNQPVAQPLVIPLGVIMSDILGEDGPQMPLTKGDDVAETLGACRSDPTLLERIQVRTSGRQHHRPHTPSLEDVSKPIPEQRIPVMDEVADILEKPIDGISEVPGHLLHPSIVGIVDNTCDVDATRLNLHDDEHGVAYEPAKGEDFDIEEVHGSQDTEVILEKGLPSGTPPPLGSWLEASIQQDASNGTASDLMSNVG